MREPLEVRVVLEEAEKTKELAQKVQDLEQQLFDMKAQRDRAEYRYRCETVINSELQDLCREHGIKFRPALAMRPWSDGPTQR